MFKPVRHLIARFSACWIASSPLSFHNWSPFIAILHIIIFCAGYTLFYCFVFFTLSPSRVFIYTSYLSRALSHIATHFLQRDSQLVGFAHFVFVRDTYDFLLLVNSMSLKSLPWGTRDCGDRPPKTYESNFIRHDFLQFGKQQSRYKASLWSILLSQQCCEVYFIPLTVAKTLWDLTTKLLKSSPLKLSWLDPPLPWGSLLE